MPPFFDVSITRSPLVIRKYPATSMMMGICARVANPRSNPTLFKTDPSITPVGGTQNPAMINPIDVTRVIQNAMLFLFASCLLMPSIDHKVIIEI